MLAARNSATSEHKDYAPRTLSGALDSGIEANLALISTPGQFAVREARLSLERGLNVMVFSDNIPVEDEVRLKELATKLGLLMMGPDCGTAYLHGTLSPSPMRFATVLSGWCPLRALGSRKLPSCSTGQALACHMESASGGGI